MKPYHRVLATLAMTAVALVSLLGGCTPTDQNNPSGGDVPPAPDNRNETIVFADVSWATSTFLSNLAGYIVDVGYGYDVEVTTAAHMVALQSIETGEIDVHMDVQVLQMADVIEELVATGKVETLGMSFTPVWLGWLVPRYMIEGDPERGIEPSMPDFEDVFDLADYWHLFPDPEDPSKGRFVNSVPGWDSERMNRLKIEAYGLDEYYNVMTPGSDAALAASMYTAYERGEPWLGYYYSPSWILGKIDMYRIPEPEYDEALWNDEAKYACGYAEDDGTIIGATSLQERAPEVRQFLLDFNLPIDNLNEVLLYMQEESGDTDDVLHWFLSNYQDVWSEWVPEDVAARVAASL